MSLQRPIFLKKIKATSLPLIKTFGDKLVGNTLSDDDIFRYFMVVALSTFLCSNSNTLPSTKYLGTLIDVSTVKDWDWSKYVFECLFASISLYRKKQRKTIGGCIYFFAAYYLDFLNFGSRHQIPPKLPRILCWRGSMIRKYASYDCVSADKFGKRPIKSIEETCYAESLLPVDACASFRDSLFNDCKFFDEQDNEALCGIFQEHHTAHGFRSPGKLVVSMFAYMKERHCHREAVDDDALPQNSAAGKPSTANVSDKDDDATAREYETPMPDGSTHTIVEDVMDTTLPAATKVIVEDVDRTMAVASKINHEEVSVTEKVDSDSAYNVFGVDNCGASQPTVIISSNDSSAQVVDSCKRKRKRKDYASQNSSLDSVACRTRHGLSQRHGKSPLSCRKDDDVEASSLDHAENGGTKDTPVPVEEAPMVASKVATKHHKLKVKGGNVPTASNSQMPPLQHEPAIGPSMDKIVKTLGKASSRRKADGSLDHSDNNAELPHETVISKDNVKLDALKNVQTAASANLKVSEPKNIPYFNSPSMPSFRFFEDEDDLGNRIEDPKLWRPVGPLSSTTCTSYDNHQREAPVLPSKVPTTHQNVQLKVQYESSFFRFCPGPEN